MPAPANYYSVAIPMKPYIKKYVQHIYGSVLRLDHSTTIGSIVLCLLTNDHYSIKISNENADQRLKHLTEKIYIIGPLKAMSYRGFTLTNDKIIAINRFFENCFTDHLHTFCECSIKQTLWRPGVDNAIRTFAESHGIEIDVDVNYEALKKSQYRYRVRHNKFIVKKAGL